MFTGVGTEFLNIMWFRTAVSEVDSPSHPRGAVGITREGGGLEMGSSDLAFPLFTIEMSLGQTLGNMSLHQALASR
jgi:hypothetical protein